MNSSKVVDSLNFSEIDSNQRVNIYTALLENGHNYDDRFLVSGHYYAFRYDSVNWTISEKQ